METIQNNSTSNGELVTVLRAENELLQQKIAQKSQELVQKSQELAAALLQNEWLLEQLKLSKKKLFGRSAEQAGEAVMEQLSLLFNEAEALDAKSCVEEQTETKVKSHTRRRRSGSLWYPW